MINNTATITVGKIPITSNVVKADILNIAISKRQNGVFSDIFVKNGDEITYTCTIQNVMNRPVFDSVFTDLLPIGTSYVIGSFTVNGNVESTIIAENLITYTIDKIVKDETVVIEFRALVL